MKQTDRRSFLKIAGTSLGIGVLYSAYPAAARGGEAGHLFSELGKSTGEKVTPFSFLQLSDAHVGFNGPPDPLGTITGVNDVPGQKLRNREVPPPDVRAPLTEGETPFGSFTGR